MGITDKIRQVKSKQGKSVKSTPASEGGLGLSPDQNSGSIDDDIRKAKENLLAKYWYDKYEELVGEVAYQQEQHGQNFKKLQEKVDVINEDVTLLEEEVSTDDPLTPLDQKFVTLDKLAEHYKLFLSRVQRQIATIGGGGIGDVVDDTSPQLGGNLDINGKNITGSGNIDITGTVDVTGVTTFEDDVTFTGVTSNLTWDASANDLEFDDDSRLKFGDGDDFQIWHGGTHTFVKNNTGELRIRGDIISLERADDTEKYLEANVNEDVKLFYNGNEKFATTNTGVSVTGNVVISDAGNIGSSSDTDAIAIASDGQVTVSQGLTVSGNLDISDTIYHTGDSNTKIRFPSVDTISFHTSGNQQMSIGSDGKVTVTGDAKVGTSQAAGVILTSPDGTEYRLIVANGGALSTSAV